MSADIESIIRSALRAESERVVPPPLLKAEILAAISSTKPASARRTYVIRQLAAALGIVVLVAGGLLGAQLLRAHKGTPPVAASPSGIPTSESPSIPPSASASASPPPASPAPSPSTSASATPFNPGYTVPDAATLSGLGYDAAHGYPILSNQQHTGNPDPGSPTFPTWKWTGSRWVQLLPTTTEHPDGNMAYDPTLGMTVGVGQSLLGWNGSAWVSVASVPTGTVSRPYLAFDQARNVLVLLDEGTYVPATWTYDGRTWTKQSNAPPGHQRFGAFAYDPNTRTVLLFGGSDLAGTFGETWEWNGASWTQLHPSKSPPAGDAVMGYDSATRQLILVASNGTTWQWNGSTWSQLAIASPPIGGYAGMVYDAVHQYLLLWEGVGASEQGSQTWAYSSAGWQRVS